MQRLFLATAVISWVCGLSGHSATFSFLRDGPFDRVDLSTMPQMTAGGITLTAVDATAPYVPYIIDERYPEGERTAVLNCNNGMGVDNLQISNAGFTVLTNIDDAAAESGALNFLETVTFCFDRSVIFSQMRIADLESGEHLTISVDGGPSIVLTTDAEWSPGSKGNTAFTGNGLKELQNYIINRDTRVTFLFDTADPQDRLGNGNGSNLAGSPSIRLTDFSVEMPSSFGMGSPFPVSGSSTQAVVGCDLYGGTGTVYLVWSADVHTLGWTHTNVVELLTGPALFTNAVMTNLSADTVYQYAFFCSDTSGQTVWSSTNMFVWASVLYVSPDGSDTNSGLSRNAPLQTIKESLKRIKNMTRPPQPQVSPPPDDLYEGIGPAYGEQLDNHLTDTASSVTVKLLPGMYRQEATQVIDRSVGGGIRFEGEWADGADEEWRTRLNRYGSDPGWLDPPETHIPVVSGGRAITNWTVTTVNGVTAWVADIPEVSEGRWYFQQLFVNGKRAERSRWPKKGWFRMEDIHTNRLEFQAFPGHMQSWTNLTDVEAVILHYWHEDRLYVTNYNAGTRQVQLSGPQPDYNLTASHVTHGTNTAAYYLDHVLETMSEPGEWYLNRRQGRLYYIPGNGQTIAETRIEAPFLRQLFKIKGSLSANEYLWDVGFSKIAFLHTRVAELGVHDGTANSPTQIGPGALQFMGVRRPRVEACLFGHMGESGVEFSEQTMRGVLGCNLFRDMAGTAFLAWQSTSSSITVQQRSGYFRVHDNDIKGYGRFWHGNVGMLLSGAIYSTVEHNHIREAYYNALRCSSGGRETNKFGFGNIIRKNHIHDIGQGWLSDLNGIYVTGVCPYTLVDGNRVHDIRARDYTSPGIYLDGTAQYITVCNNWVYNCNVKNMNIKGWSHTITNNVVAYAGLWSVMRLNSDVADDPGYAPLGGLAGRQPPLFRGNIYLQDGGEVYDHSKYTQWPADWGISESNLVYDTAGPIRIGSNMTLSVWRETEQKDFHTVEADPQFENPLRGDFRLKPNSPASGIGIVSVDNRDAGVRSNAWLSAGAVLYEESSEILPDWMPSDVPGLHGWLDAADLAPGKLSEWKTKTPYSYTMRQFDTAAQPDVVPYALRGLPVVRFSGAQWMGTQESLWDASKYCGRFEDRPFTVFSVHHESSAGTLMVKGNGGTGEWLIQTNSFCRNGIPAGVPGSGWKVRAWQREGEALRYYENGVLVTQTLIGAEWNFNSEDDLYLGGNTNPAIGKLVGDVAEILIYRGALSPEHFDRITRHLTGKWIPDTVPFIANDSGALPGFGKATLRAELTVSSPATVVFFWGTTDGGTHAAEWEYAVTNAGAQPGTVSVPLTGLSSQDQYYYRCFAFTEYGSAWAGSTAEFKTQAPDRIVPLPEYTANLQIWLDAGDLDGDGISEGVAEQNFWVGTVSAWNDKSANRYRFLQPDPAHQPALIMDALNGKPVLRFSATVTNWVENADGTLGRFGTNDFAIFTVHRSSGVNATVLSKGAFGGSGRWDIGSNQNQMRWDSSNYIGRAGAQFSVRCYQRTGGVMRYYENGKPLADSPASHNFTGTDPLYIGRRGTEGRAMDGDIAEIMIYTGTVSSAACGRISSYLGQKWLGWIPATPRGTPYEWMERFGITVNHDEEDEKDGDGDGFTAWQEYLAGTDPLNGNSFLQLTDITFTNGTAVVSWYGTGSGSSVPWSMYVSTNLTEGWTLLQSNSIPRNPQNGTNIWLDTSAGNEPVRFYRPGILRP